MATTARLLGAGNPKIRWCVEVVELPGKTCPVAGSPRTGKSQMVVFHFHLILLELHR